jgi:hypothetical protein
MCPQPFEIKFKETKEFAAIQENFKRICKTSVFAGAIALLWLPSSSLGNQDARL